MLRAAETEAALGAYREALDTLASVRDHAHGADLARLLGLRADLLMAGADSGAVDAYREALTATTQPALRSRLRARLARAACFAGDLETAAVALDGLTLDGSPHVSPLWIVGGIGVAIALLGAQRLMGLSLAQMGAIAGAIFLPALMTIISGMAVRDGAKARHEAQRLADAADRLLNPEQSAEEAGRKLAMTVRGEINQLDRALEQTLQRLQEVEGQIARQALSVDAMGAQAKAGANEMISGMERERGELMKISRDLSAQAQTIGNSISRHTQSISEAARQAEAEVRAADQALDHRLTSFGAAAALINDRTHGLSSAAQASAEFGAASGDRAFDRARYSRQGDPSDRRCAAIGRRRHGGGQFHRRRGAQTTCAPLTTPSAPPTSSAARRLASSARPRLRWSACRTPRKRRASPPSMRARRRRKSDRFANAGAPAGAARNRSRAAIRSLVAGRIRSPRCSASPARAARSAARQFHVRRTGRGGAARRLDVA